MKSNRFFNLSIILFREGVSGVKGSSHPTTGVTWNIFEWELND